MSDLNYREIKVPPLGESVNEATVARWSKRKGDLVKMDEVIVELETDKVTLEVTAPTTGLLHTVHAESGDTVRVGEILGTIHMSEDATGYKEPQHEPAHAKEPVHEEKVVHHHEHPVEKHVEHHPEHHHEHHHQEGDYSPAVLRLLVENRLDPALIPTSGRDGRLTKEDIIRYLEGEASRVVEEKPVHKAEIVPPVKHVVHHKEEKVVEAPVHHHQHKKESSDREVRVKMSRLRQKVAERLKYSQNTAAILTTFNEVDMTAINNLRALYKDAYEKKYGIKLGFMSFFVKAAIQALKEIPSVNAEILGDEIIYKNYYDIGVAVSAPQGLVVPVVRDADFMSFADVEKAIGDLGRKAKEGKLSLEDMSGGTFTVSNGGIFGSLMSTPILNPPQTGILGMHKVQERPVVIDGKIEIRPMMYIALSYDHRLIDGREAVTFLVRVKENIERPERLLLEI